MNVTTAGTDTALNRDARLHHPRAARAGRDTRRPTRWRSSARHGTEELDGGPRRVGRGGQAGVTAAALDTATLRPDRRAGPGRRRDPGRRPDVGRRRAPAAWLRVRRTLTVRSPAARRRRGPLRAIRRGCSTSWPRGASAAAEHRTGAAPCGRRRARSRGVHRRGALGLGAWTSAAAAAAAIAARPPASTAHDVAVVLGSGWRPAADVIGTPERELPMADLPGFVPPTVAGHGGTIRSVRVGERRVLVLLGRTHLYEGHGVGPVAHGVRTAAAAGCRTVVLTNAAGGIRQGMSVGEPVLIADHLNLTGDAPRSSARGFVDLTDLYSPAPARPAPGRSTRRSPRASTPACPARTSRRPPRSGCCGAGRRPGRHVDGAGGHRARAAEGVEVFGLSLVTNLAAGHHRRAARPPGGAGRGCRRRRRGWARCCAT